MVDDEQLGTNNPAGDKGIFAGNTIDCNYKQSRPNKLERASSASANKHQQMNPSQQWQPTNGTQVVIMLSYGAPRVSWGRSNAL